LLRTEAADAAKSLSESPHCAFAVRLNAIISNAREAALTTVMLWINLNLLMPLILSAIWFKGVVNLFIFVSPVI
jgi:hypothetical protein